MLVLERRAGESVCIGDQIVVKVLRVIGSRVELGIEAPKSVPILRDDAVRKEAS